MGADFAIDDDSVRPHDCLRCRLRHELAAVT
jgi:hypothetical protein